jgi:hypothetical protein
MALTKEDFVGAVARLNDLTRLQVIKWTPCSTPQKPAAGLTVNELLGGPFQAEYSFETTYDQRILRITQYKSSLATLLSGRVYKYSLDFRDQDGNVVFEFPEVEGIADLFRSVQTQKLDIEGFIKKLVSG